MEVEGLILMKTTQNEALSMVNEYTENISKGLQMVRDVTQIIVIQWLQPFWQQSMHLLHKLCTSQSNKFPFILLNDIHEVQ